MNVRKFLSLYYDLFRIVVNAVSIGFAIVVVLIFILMLADVVFKFGWGYRWWLLPVPVIMCVFAIFIRRVSLFMLDKIRNMELQ